MELWELTNQLDAQMKGVEYHVIFAQRVILVTTLTIAIHHVMMGVEMTC